MRIIGGCIRGGLLAVAFALQSAAFAASSTCVPKAEMQVLAKNFKQFETLANSDYCYDGSTTSGLIEALEFMRHTPYAKSMPKSNDELFSGTFAQDWYGYFIGRIDELQVEESCPKGVGAFVYMFANTMHVCPMLLTDSFSSVDRISVMMHEARHIDGFPHVTCSKGPRAGIQGACDNRISDQGSYGVSVETYAQLGAYATDLHPALKAYARASSVNYALEAFEIPARVDFTPKFLLMTTQKEFYGLPADGTNQVERLGDAPALGHIVMRARHMILFPEDKTLPSGYVFAQNQGAITQAAGDLAAEYNQQTPQQRSDLVDLHIGAQWSARVYRDRVKFACDPTRDVTEDIALSGQAPAGMIYPEGYDRVHAAALLATESGAILEIGCQARRAFVRTSTVALDQKYKRIHKAGDLVLGLSKDGRLFKLNGSSSSPLQTSVDGRINELVPSQNFSFFNAADLGS